MRVPPVIWVTIWDGNREIKIVDDQNGLVPCGSTFIARMELTPRLSRIGERLSPGNVKRRHAGAIRSAKCWSDQFIFRGYRDGRQLRSD
jgi:hypothetical protein